MEAVGRAVVGAGDLARVRAERAPVGVPVAAPVGGEGVALEAVMADGVAEVMGRAGVAVVAVTMRGLSARASASSAS
jgi:hypothetical protein